MESKKARITGTGSYLPKKILSNQDLEKMVDTSDEWIVTRTGMKERRLAAEDEYTSDMGCEAAKKAIAAAGLKPKDVDYIIFATLTPDYIFPSTACLIQSRLKLINASALDIQAACSGYLYGLSIAKSFVETGAYRNILVVASEKLSSIVDYEDRNTCVLFGDGAAACIVSADQRKPGFSIDYLTLGADGDQAELLILPAGGSRQPASTETIKNKLHFLQMGGKEVFKHAVRRMESAAKECLDKMQLIGEQIRWMIPHQANVRIIEAIAKRFNIPMKQVFMTIQKYGNTSASSVGIALDELLADHTKLQDKDHLMLVAFGAGLTWGAGILTRESHA